MNSRCPFQFFGHWDYGKTNDDIYMLDPYPPLESVILKEPPSVMPDNFTFVPTTYNKSALYRPYIQQLPSDPQYFSLSQVVKSTHGYVLQSSYCEHIKSFLKKNKALYMDWRSVAQSLAILIPHVEPRAPPASAELDAPRASSIHHGMFVYNILQGAYEFGGFAHLLACQCIRHVAHTFGVSPPQMGVDETLIGAIFVVPLKSQNDGVWLEELLAVGVPVFGVVEGPVLLGAHNIKEVPNGAQVSAPAGKVLPSS